MYPRNLGTEQTQTEVAPQGGAFGAGIRIILMSNLVGCDGLVHSSAVLAFCAGRTMASLQKNFLEVKLVAGRNLMAGDSNGAW